MKAEILFDENEVKELDRITIQERGISAELLMGFAAVSVFKKWESVFLSTKQVFVFCGTGNNGGDGYALAQFLYAEGVKVRIFAKGEPRSEESKYYKNLCKNSGIKILTLDTFHPEEIEPQSVLVDCLLGTGFQEPLSEDLAKVIEKLSQAKQKGGDQVFLISLDAEKPIRVDALAEIGAPKIRNLFYPIEEEKKSFHPIGFLRNEFVTEQRRFVCENPEALRIRLQREWDSHKYKNGSAMFIGGSEGMYGAILSAALAFHELGGGISQILSPSPSGIAKILKKDSSLMIGPLETKKDPFQTSFAKKAKVYVIGPGLGKSDFPDFPFPQKIKLVLDAGILSEISERNLSPQMLLTPHLGEFGQILGKSYSGIYHAWRDARSWAKERNCHLLLKGPVSILLTPQGISYFWEFQEPKLAVMGTGDLLTGILAFFLSRGEEIPEAVRLAQSVLLYCARSSKGYPTANRLRKKIRILLK